MKVTILLEDRGTEHLALRVEHGLSMWVEYNGKKLLFDFSGTDAALENAKKLGIDISEADYMLCSHAHYDHASGFVPIMERGLAKSLITGRHFFEGKHIYDGIKYNNVGTGFTKKKLDEYDVAHTECGDMLELMPGCYVISNFERTHEFETLPKGYVKETEEGFVKDNVDDEICLAFDTADGLVVLVGCSHPGILNMLSTISKRLGKHITAVFGGTHLMQADDKRIALTLEEIKKMNIDLIGFCHCSGKAAYAALKADGNIKSCDLATGDVLVIE